MDHALPRARACMCLAEDLGLWFKSLFIDSYKGESELLTCSHSTKSIRMSFLCANAVQQGWRVAWVPPSYCRHLWLLLLTPGTGAWPPISRPLSTSPWAGTGDAGKPSPAGLMGGSCPHPAKTGPQTHGFHGKI